MRFSFEAAKKTPSVLNSSSGCWVVLAQTVVKGWCFGIYVFSISSHHRLGPLIKYTKNEYSKSEIKITTKACKT